MIGSSSIMIHDELWYCHVRMGDVGKSGPPMTSEPNLVGQGVNRNQLEIPIEEN